jgi:hypothetical protein
MIYFVTSTQVLNEFSKSKYFSQTLGLVSTVEKNGRRVFNDADKFSHHYNTQYKTIIHTKGKVGNILFYIDYYIRDLTFAVYIGDTFEEFLFEYDFNMVKDKGIDFYIGHLIKEVELKYEDRLEKNTIKEKDEQYKGNADVLIANPGAVTYADLKAYIDKKQKERYQ